MTLRPTSGDSREGRDMIAPRVDRMVIVYERRDAKRYTPPKPGATKVTRGMLHVRVRETTISYGIVYGVSRRGRPAYEWQPVPAPVLGIRELRLS